jgi:hypothetical protein
VPACELNLTLSCFHSREFVIEHVNSPLTKRMHTWYKTIAPENEVTRLFAKLKTSHDVINIIKWLKRIHLEIWRFCRV